LLVWNRLRFVKDPSTGKPVSRPNPESECIRAEVPHLRIVDDVLWNAVRERQKQIAAIFGPKSRQYPRRPYEAPAPREPARLFSFPACSPAVAAAAGSASSCRIASAA
jgi:hypothetical protein